MYNLRIAHQNCLSECQTPEQEAIARTLEEEIPLLGTPESFFYKMVQDLTKKRQRMGNSLRAIGAVPVVPEGGYLMLVNWAPLGKDESKNSAVDFGATFHGAPNRRHNLNLVVTDGINWKIADECLPFKLVLCYSFTGDKIDLSMEKQKEEDFKLASWLHREKKLVGIPPSAFYSENHRHLAKGFIRFNFYKKEETLDEADKIFKTFN